MRFNFRVGRDGLSARFSVIDVVVSAERLFLSESAPLMCAGAEDAVSSGTSLGTAAAVTAG